MNLNSILPPTICTSFYLHTAVIVKTFVVWKYFPSMDGDVAPSGAWRPSKDTSIFLYPQLLSPNVIFLGILLHPSGKFPPTFFFVFLLIFCYGISHSDPL
jgi:hypothetical protein